MPDKEKKLDLEMGPGVLVKRYAEAPALVGAVTVQLVGVLLCVMNYDTLHSINSTGACAVISSCLSGLSQGLLQLFVYHELSISKLSKFYVYGIVSGIWTKLWTDQLAEIFSSALIKIFWDQAIGTPIGLFLFCMFSAFWDGLNMDKYFQTHYIRILRASYVIWPIASTIAFTLLPHDLIVPFNALVNLGWTTLLGLLPSEKAH